MGTVDFNFFRFIPAAVFAFGNPSHKFSILENFTRRALRRISSRPVSLNLPVNLGLMKKFKAFNSFSGIRKMNKRCYFPLSIITRVLKLSSFF